MDRGLGWFDPPKGDGSSAVTSFLLTDESRLRFWIGFPHLVKVFFRKSSWFSRNLPRQKNLSEPEHFSLSLFSLVNLRTHRIQYLVAFQVVRLQAPCQRLSRFGDDMCGPKQEPQTMRNAIDTQILFNMPYIVMICILHTVIIAWSDYIHIMNVYTFDVRISYIQYEHACNILS